MTGETYEIKSTYLPLVSSLKRGSQLRFFTEYIIYIYIHTHTINIYHILHNIYREHIPNYLADSESSITLKKHLSKVITGKNSSPKLGCLK